MWNETPRPSLTIASYGFFGSLAISDAISPLRQQERSAVTFCVSANPYTSAVISRTLLEVDVSGGRRRRSTTIALFNPTCVQCGRACPPRHHMQPCRAMPSTRTATSTRRPTPSAWVSCPEQWQALRQKCPREGFGSTYKAPASLSPREPKYAGTRDAHGASLEADSGFQRNEFPWLWLRTCSPQHTCGINLCMMRLLLLASAQRFRCAEGLWI